MKFALPYQALAKHGIHPGLSTQQIVVDLVRPSDPTEYEAWMALSNPYTRLAADFFLYQLRAREAWLAVVQTLIDGEMPEESDLRRDLGEDAALMLLLSGRRKLAGPSMEASFRAAPSDSRLAHELAIFNVANASGWESAGNLGEAEPAWRDAVAFLCRTLADDVYWRVWSAARLAVYGRSHPASLTPARIEDLRNALRTRLSEYFSRRADQFERGGDSAGARLFRELESLVSVEWRAALATRRVSVVSGKGYPFGPLLWAKIGDEESLAAMVRACRHEVARYEGMEIAEALSREGPAIDDRHFELLRFSFSRLAKPAALLDAGRAEEALREIDSIGSVWDPRRDPIYAALPDSAAVFAMDSAVLRLRALIERAASAPPLPSGAGILRAALHAILEFGKQAGVQAESIRAIADFAIGRAEVLRAETPPDLEETGSLTRAIDVLELAFAVLGRDVSPEELSLELAKALLCRGVRLEKADRHEAAYVDLRRAWMLYPDYTGILTGLCLTLYYWARDLRSEGSCADARAKAEEALNILGSHSEPDCEDIRRRLREEIAILDGKDPSQPYWSELDQALRDVPELGQPDGEIDLDAALQRIQTEDWPGAFESLAKAMPEALRNPALWRRVADATLRLFCAGGRTEGLVLLNRFADAGASHAGFRDLEAQIHLAISMFEQREEI